MAQEQPVSLSELMSSSRLYRMRRIVRFIPRSPRCKLCNVPFAGPGRVFRLAGFGQSRKNPNMCTACFERAPVGGAEIEVGVLFADVRGYTALVESASPGEAATLLAPFYRAARDVLMRKDAVIDKLVGDEVMGLFIPLFIGEDAIRKMVEAGIELLEQTEVVGLEVGAGADFGVTYVGTSAKRKSRTSLRLGTLSTQPPGCKRKHSPPS